MPSNPSVYYEFGALAQYVAAESEDVTSAVTIAGEVLVADYP